MTDTAIAPRKDSLLIMREYLEQRRDQLQAAASDIPAQRIIDAAITAAALNPDIFECSRQSIMQALLRACRDGLLPDGIEGVIVPFKKQATWIRTYVGLLRQFRRSGQFKWIKADVVREGDEFDHFVDEHGEHFRHRARDSFSAPITKAYAAAITKDDGFFVTVMTLQEINKHKAKSRATRDDAPWREWFEEMAKKTCIIRLSKVLPSARDIVGEEEESGGSGEEETPKEQISAAERTPAATLAQVAASSSPPADETTASAGATAAADVGAGDQSREQGENEQDEPDAPEQIAYDRGAKARAAGHSAKALPGEYRGQLHQREAICWQAGFEGKVMPTFASQQGSIDHD
jgi:recombination protein RecT